MTVTITARLARGFTGPSITNTAAAASTVTDPDSANNSSSVDGRRHDQRRPVRRQDRVAGDTRPRHRRRATRSPPPTTVPRPPRASSSRDTVPPGSPSTRPRAAPPPPPAPSPARTSPAPSARSPSGQVTVSITGTLGSQFAGTSVTNTTTHHARRPTTPTPADNTATVTSAVVGQADLALVKTMSPANPVAGQQVVFTLTATNNGPSAALNPQFIDQLPAGLTNVSVVPPPGATGCDVVPPVDPGTADNPNAPTVVCSGPIFRAGFTVCRHDHRDRRAQLHRHAHQHRRARARTPSTRSPTNNESTVSGTRRASPPTCRSPRPCRRPRRSPASR